MFRRLLLDPAPTDGGGEPQIQSAEELAASMVAQLPAGETGGDLLGDFNPIEAPAATSAPAAAAPAPTDPALAAARTPAAPAPAAEYESIRDAAASYGVDLSQFPDDQAALAHLLRQNQAAQQDSFYANLGRKFAPEADKFKQYLQTQQAQAVTAKPAWEPPEFDERWLHLVKKDDTTGAYTALPNVNPVVAEKVQAYADWLQGFQRNPSATIAPMVEQRARAIADERIEARFAVYQEQQQIQTILQANSPWLYQVDPTTNAYRYGPEGKPIPSPLGARYVTHLQDLQANGIKNPQILDRLAKQLLQADLAVAGQTKQQQVAKAGAPQARAAVARPSVNQGQAVSAARGQNVPGTTDPDLSHLNLTERLTLAFNAGGIQDTDFADMFTS